MEPRTLVLSPWGSPNRIATWQEAVCLIVLEKARVEASYDPREHGLIVSQRLTMPAPAVIRLSRDLAHTKTSVKFSRSNMLARDRYRCCYCPPHVSRKTPRELTYDHVLPRSRGGKTNWSNIVLACKPCNLRKKNKTPQEAGMKMHWKPYAPKTLPLTAPLLVDASKIHPLWVPYMHDAQATG